MAKAVQLNRIKSALAEKGVKGFLLAIYMGVHETTVSDWCTNKSQPSPKDFIKIANFLNLNVRELIQKIEPVPNMKAELMIAEVEKFEQEGNLIHVNAETKTKKKKKIINPELAKRLKIIIGD
ncbi:helix-turn-helix domain-containing protein [Mucilaginibacter psychrotolerans]|uniref:XRE family transcriptional regulator n=1 Tax=Mucilaginibacter psychrotolerans TaxID=1524096 RepID=A0A4Y8SEM8_9SPHI|nr:helix-turn-helix transcriptional regulator [Mucilaginibacter psychrotolerans]TFF37017.1 XRE family transcriptional regulator [Mucilaginibacter psychrotolerans]